MEIGQTIEDIRKSKGLSVKEICGNFISRSNYHRFSNGEINTSSKSFIQLLDSLNMTSDEFFFIHNNYKKHTYQIHFEQLYHGYLSNNLEMLTLIKTDCQRLYKHLNHYKYVHLMMTASLLISRLENKPLNSNHRQILSNYLLNSDRWTYYELILFSNTFFIFRGKTINLMIKTALKCAKKFATMNRSINETARLLCHVVLYFLEINDKQSANKWLIHLRSLDLNENLFYEKILIAFTTSLVQLANGQKDEKINIQRLLSVLDTLDMPLHKRYFDYLLDRLDRRS